MKLSIAASLLPLVASAVVLPRQQSWDEYDATTDILIEDGLCRSYRTLNPPPEAAGLVMCEIFCAPARELAGEDETFSWTCFGDTAPNPVTVYDPAGEPYTYGECKCNHPAINFVGETFVELLPYVGRVTCAVWKLAISEAAIILAGTPFTASTASMTLFKVAKTIASTGSGASGWEEWIARVSADDPCDFSPGQIFEDFTGISDEDISAVL
ncbi:uncharacterized protein J7T54_000467 [Emericellopsis cladophorae]|uniref:Uncharacterized protein n=1 Tax=Emericellopsis cladophorae TaxID=2686198 RepID=A0A9P9XXY4_9HYPO|nr:uncharacterized protein J7T54_000467 [Emericellopsis cladophorae]KAI6779369.1 hypothetical protein J7T54_000467 [Emericellopsis cladophorae]